jgi:N-acetylmuramoyl-L-alanine amidase
MKGSFLRYRVHVILALILGICGIFLPCHTAVAQNTNSANCVTLDELGRLLGARVWYDPLTQSGGIERYGIFGSFSVDQAILIWDWRSAQSVPPPRETQAGLCFDRVFVETALARFSSYRAAMDMKYSIAAILIDPGHGGKDTGAVGEYGDGEEQMRLAEKDITLIAARRVMEQLKARYPDRRIQITREGDTYPTLEERVDMANQVKLSDREAIIYVSIHANASFNKSAKGFEVWYLNPEYRRTVVDAETVRDKGKDIAPILNAMLEEEFTTESIILARRVLDRLSTTIGDESLSRGIRAEEWFVVRNARMPSILIEMGFVTNPGEARLLADPGYLRMVSDAIYNGIVDFIGHFEG